MTEREREDFISRAETLTAGQRERGLDPGPTLAPLFAVAVRRHPDEEGWLLELWDRLTSRPAL